MLGWLLGLLSPAIVGFIKDRREAKIIKIALFTELREFQYRLLLLVFRIESKYGQLNPEFFKLAQSVLSGYSGINSSDTLLERIGPLLKLTSEEMATLLQYAKQQKPNSGLSLKKQFLPLLESNIAHLAKFDKILQSQLLEIRTKIGFINEAVDEAHYYFRLSFQNDISEKNYDIANNNMIETYKVCASQAREIIRIINEILNKK